MDTSKCEHICLELQSVNSASTINLSSTRMIEEPAMPWNSMIADSTNVSDLMNSILVAQLALFRQTASSSL